MLGENEKYVLRNTFRIDDGFNTQFKASFKYITSFFSFAAVVAVAASVSVIQKVGMVCQIILNECIYLELASELADVYRREKLCYNLSIFSFVVPMPVSIS